MISRVLLAFLLGARHPIHTSSAWLTLDPGSQSATVLLRVFAEDFPPGRVPEAVQQYLTARFRVLDAAGSALPLRLDSLVPEGPLLRIRLSVAIPRDFSVIRIWHGVLTERFRDQVNFVQASLSGRKSSLLFTSRDGPKPLP